METEHASTQLFDSIRQDTGSFEADDRDPLSQSVALTHLVDNVALEAAHVQR